MSLNREVMTGATPIRPTETHWSDLRRTIAPSALVASCWLVAVVSTGQLPRAQDNLAAAITMVFGSFVAGSTPQGGGAVAFPVFTKLLGVSAAEAATFSLSIQAIGMGTAAISIAMARRPVDRTALRITVPAAVAGYLLGAVLVGFVSLPEAYVKVTFTLMVLAAGIATWRCGRHLVTEHRREVELSSPGVRRWLMLISGVGGAGSALFGSGADIAVYLCVVVVLGVHPSVGVATSVVTMASVSVVGLAISLATGQLPLSSGSDTDLFGMWLAAVPVVVVGAPLGSWFAARISAVALSRFIAILALGELISTVVFLEQLRQDPLLVTFAVASLLTTVAGVRAALKLRNRLAPPQPKTSTNQPSALHLKVLTSTNGSQ